MRQTDNRRTTKSKLGKPKSFGGIRTKPSQQIRMEDLSKQGWERWRRLCCAERNTDLLPTLPRGQHTLHPALKEWRETQVLVYRGCPYVSSPPGDRTLHLKAASQPATTLPLHHGALTRRVKEAKLWRQTFYQCLECTERQEVALDICSLRPCRQKPCSCQQCIPKWLLLFVYTLSCVALRSPEQRFIPSWCTTLCPPRPVVKYSLSSAVPEWWGMRKCMIDIDLLSYKYCPAVVIFVIIII